MHLDNDDLVDRCRPAGLPIGNLTSQFWSNCYLNPLDHYIRRQLRCRDYIRYADDLALFSKDAEYLRFCRDEVRQFCLNSLRLKLHWQSAQVNPVSQGVPWLGYVVWANRSGIKSRQAWNQGRKLRKIYRLWQAGEVPFSRLDAAVKGWVGHAHHADTWQLRNQVLEKMPLKP